MDRAERWLYSQRSRLLDARRASPDAGNLRARTLDGLAALVAAGAVDPEAAEAFRVELDAEPASSPGPDPRAEALLARMLDELPADPDDDEEAIERFEGAVRLLDAAGLACAGEWEARLDRRYGWGGSGEDLAAEPRAGGTRVDLVSVHAGPPEWRDGYRLVFLLRFADAVKIRLERDPGGPEPEDWPEWVLRDSSGGRSDSRGGSVSEEEEEVDFADGLPAGAQWAELTRPDRPAVVFRVPL